MAHTCHIYTYTGRIIAPTEDSFEVVQPKRSVNRRYHHDGGSWKATTKTRKQWGRHKA